VELDIETVSLIEFVKFQVRFLLVELC
jgi:hypothetical protein